MNNTKTKNHIISGYIVSTTGFYDERIGTNSFVPIRNRIMQLFDKLGIVNRSFESPSFVTKTRQEIIDNCLSNIKQSQLFVCLINERYGTTTNDGVSITEEEIKAVIQSNQAAIILVEEKVEAVYNEVCNLKKEDAIAYLENIKERLADTPENTYLIVKLINDIRLNKENRCTTYPFNKNNIDELIDRLEERICEYGKMFFLTEYVNHFSKINIKKLSYADTYIDVPFTYITPHKEIFKDCLEKRIFEVNRGNNPVIKGAKGSGKSVQMALIYAHFNETIYKDHASYERVPIFIKMATFPFKRMTRSNLIKYYQISSTNTLGYALPSNMLQKVNFMLFVDALDEWEFINNERDLSALIKDLNSFDKYVISVTNTRFNGVRHLFGSNPVYEILGWDVHLFSEKIINNNLTNEEISDLNRMFEAISKTDRNEDRHGSLSPFVIVNLLNCYSDNKDEMLKIFKDQDQFPFGLVMKRSVEISIRERINKESLADNKITPEYALKLLVDTGWCVFESKNKLRYDDLVKYLKRRKYMINDSAIQIISLYFDVSNSNVFNLVYPRHDLFVTYFISEKIVSFLKNSDYEFLMKHMIPSETNRMIKDLLSFEDDATILKIFNDGVEFLGKIDSNKLHEQLMCIYFLPRIAISKYKNHKFLEMAVDFLKNKKETTKGLLLIPIYSWLTQLGLMQFEDEYINLIKNDKDMQRYQIRCYYIYQDNVRDVSFEDEITSYKDWKYAADSFIEHCKTNELRQMFVRRIDLCTIQLFIQNGATIYDDFASFFLDYLNDEYLIDITMGSENSRYRQIIRKLGDNYEEYMEKSLLEEFHNVQKLLRQGLMRKNN